MKSFQDLEAGGTFTSKRRDSIIGKQDPIQAVSLGVFEINKSVTTFERLVNDLGTAKDTPQLRRKLRSTRLRIAQLEKYTSAKLKQASEDQRTEVGASEKLASYAKDFEKVLKEFQKAECVATEKEKQYASFAPNSVPSSYIPSEQDRNLDKNPEQRTALIESREQDVFLLDNEIVLNEALIEEREQGIKEIPNQIVEVHEIFKDLAALVHEQGDAIHHIDSNVNNSHTAIEQGNSQLEKAAKTQKSNSPLTCLSVILGLVWSS
ncbi:hypothetical protein MKW98_011160 [Papaver atlanticum]|uniref:t-SNARE coiled-coil homology domain-containing protein n=1 Tax=Papaver atlanticum TaxID=357466 RepID=A0AAD4TFM5_9MAGN|nr:hypothetical protein MKW98_011160 [Papaver atlanticum]